MAPSVVVTAGEGVSNSGRAPSYPVPPSSLTSIEHPFIIKSLSRAVASLGGADRVGRVVTSTAATHQAELYLKPESSSAQSISSRGVATGNVLLQVAVPKRTGRKRKRGSDDLFQDCSEPLKPLSGTDDVRTLRQKLRDNPDDYTIKVVGQIDRTYRFRSMHDFVYSTQNNAFVQRVETELLPMKYESIKKFKFDTDGRGPVLNSALIPPPTFSNFHIPFNYAYSQNPAILEVVGSDGGVQTFNDQAARKSRVQRVTFDVKQVPNRPSANILPFELLDKKIKDLVKRVETLFNRRPIWTRRAVMNVLPELQWESLAKPTFQYVAYEFQSGPWRGTLVKFGVDPRTDSKYRIFQSMMFQFDILTTVKKTVYSSGRRLNLKRDQTKNLAAGTQAKQSNSHIFDGSTVDLDGKVWQVCDITDEAIRGILKTNNIRKKCHISSDGWYHNGTWAKAKILTKAKILGILQGRNRVDPEDLAMILSMPENLHKSGAPSARQKVNDEFQTQSWMATIRGIVSTPERESGDESHQGDSQDDETEPTPPSSRTTRAAAKGGLQKTFRPDIAEVIETFNELDETILTDTDDEGMDVEKDPIVTHEDDEANIRSEPDSEEAESEENEVNEEEEDTEEETGSDEGEAVEDPVGKDEQIGNNDSIEEGDLGTSGEESYESS